MTKLDRVIRMSEDAKALPEFEVKTLMRPNHKAFQVGSSWLGQVGIGQSSWEV